MLLSVAMIVKNEEKYLDKTLKALNPLSEYMDLEVIIVDTGSTDNTVNIAKKYTDKVFHEEWNGNFADMRNKSISYAKGDWILIIDADEELVDFSNFIKFIESGDAGKYNTGVIKLNNFLNESMTKVTEAPMPRLFKNDGKFKYQGRIHEQPMFKAPVYNPFGGVMTFNHYGYMYEDESIRQRKMKRNEELLIKELEENPNDPYMNYQLGQNFMVLNNLTEAIFYLEKSVSLYSKQKKVYIPAVVKLSCSYLFSGENLKAERECLKYLKTDKKNIDIYYYLAVSQYRMSKFNEAVVNFEKYFYYIKNYNQSTQATNIACNCETMKYKSKAVMYCSDSYSKVKKYNKAMEILKLVSIDSEDISDIYPMLIDLLIKTEKYDDIVSCMDTYVKSGINKRAFLSSLESIVLKLRVENKDVVYNSLSKIEGNYGLLNKCRLLKTVKDLDVFSILNNESDFFYGDLLRIYLDENKDFNSALLSIDRNKMYGYIKYLYSNDKNYIDRMYSYISDVNTDFSIEKISMRVVVLKSLLDSKCLSKDRMNIVFRLYIFDRYRQIKLMFNKNILDTELMRLVVDKEDYFILKIKLLWSHRVDDRLAFVRGFKNLMIEYPGYKNELENVINNFVEEAKKSSSVDPLKSEYFKIMTNVYGQGDFNTYSKLVNDYCDLNPGDTEILPHLFTVKFIEGSVSEAMDIAWNIYINDGFNYDNIYNMGCVVDSIDKNASMHFYNIILNESNAESLLSDIYSKFNK